MSNQRILFLDQAGYPPLPSRASLSIISEGAMYECVSSATAACSVLSNNSGEDYLAVVSNTADPAVFDAARKTKALAMLVTDLPMEQYSQSLDGREEVLLDHIVAFRSNPDLLVHDLRVALQKIIRNDIFGIQKYLASGTTCHDIRVASTGERDLYNNKVVKFAEECRVGSHIAKAIWGISEEMLMNAIYDAPAAAGIQRVRGPGSPPTNLPADEQATLHYGCDGDFFAIGVSDPFGLFTQERLFLYLKKVLRRNDSKNLIDTKEGGAGLGLFKILFSCHTLICNVKRHAKTEIIAVIDINEQLRDFSRMARSIHYFLDK